LPAAYRLGILLKKRFSIICRPDIPERQTRRIYKQNIIIATNESKMYQLRKLKNAQTVWCESLFSLQGKIIVGIIICSILFLSRDNISAKAIHQVHPPPFQVHPSPPRQYLEKAYFYKWRCEDVIKALKDSGLEAVVLTGGIIANSPEATESTVFLMPRFGKDTGGVVSSYDSESKLLDALNYFASMNKDPQSPAWRIFRKDNILLLISGKVPEERSLEYSKALNKMKK